MEFAKAITMKRKSTAPIPEAITRLRLITVQSDSGFTEPAHGGLRCPTALPGRLSIKNKESHRPASGYLTQRLPIPAAERTRAAGRGEIIGQLSDHFAYALVGAAAVEMF